MTTLPKSLALPTIPNSGREVVLRGSGIRKAFGGMVVLDGLEFELRRGEVVILRGGNGSGKTTLLNILTGNLEPDAGTLRLSADGGHHNFSFPPRWCSALNLFDTFTPEGVSRRGIGRSWQDIRLFRTQTLRDNLATAAPGQLGENPLWAVLRRGRFRAQEEDVVSSAQELLRDLGLAGSEGVMADRVSLGQAKRAAIARAVQGGARVLLLDEPLSGLDSDGCDQVLQLLDRLVADRGLTLVIVEHTFHIPRLLRRASTIWTLEGGRLLAQPAGSVLADRTNEDPLQGWLADLGLGGRTAEYPLPGGAMLTLIGTPKLGASLLRVRNLAVSRGARRIVGEDGGLSFELRTGELGLLRAPNGWGKTTLLEAIAGVIPIDSGSVLIGDQAVQGTPPWDRFRAGLRFLRSRDQTFPNLSVAESFGIALGKSELARVPVEVRAWSGRRVSTLSGGQRQQVALACSVAETPGLVLCLDEPFGALDRAAAERLQRRIGDCLDGSACLITEPSVWSATLQEGRR